MTAAKARMLLFYAYAVLALLVLMDAFTPLLQQGRARESIGQSETMYVQLTSALIYVVAACLALPGLRFRRAANVTPAGLLLVGFPILMTASLLWSVEPEITARRALGLIGTTVFGFVLYRRLGFTRSMWLVCIACSIAVVSSLVLVGLNPGVAVHMDVHAGAWRGVFFHKNRLGRAAVYAVVSLLIVWFLRNRPISSRALAGYSSVLACALVTVWFSRSAGAVVNCSLFLGVILSIWPVAKRNGRPGLRAQVVLGSVGVGALVAALLGYTAILEVLGRDATLTGRVPYWQEIIRVVSEKRLSQGFGFDAFFASGIQEDEIDGWTSGHAHNGIIQLFADTGLIGLLLFLVSLFALALRSRRNRVGNDAQKARLGALLLMGLVLLTNMTVSDLVASGSITWVLFLIGVLEFEGTRADSALDLGRLRAIAR